MKLLFDWNFSWRLVRVVSHAFPGSAHVVSVGLSRASDTEVSTFARENGCRICPEDADFYQLSLLYGPPPKVVWLQTANRSTSEIAALLQDHLAEIRDFDSTDEALMITRQVESAP